MRKCTHVHTHYFASSSSRAVEGHQQGMTQRTLPFLNRARAACARSRVWAYASRRGLSLAATRRNILPAFVSKATASSVSVGLHVFNKASPKLKCAIAVLICLVLLVRTWMRRHSFLPAISLSVRVQIVVYISLRLLTV